MEVYYILTILIIITSYLLRKDKKKLSYVLFTYLLIVIGLRHQSMGYDLMWKYSGGYLDWFDTISRADFGDLFMYSLLTSYDIGFVFLNRIIGVISNDRQVYLFVCALISILPFAFYTSRESKSPLLSIAIFIGLPTFLYLYGTLRQSVATGVLVLSLPYLEKRDKKFFFFLFLAVLLHAASIVFVIAYFVYNFHAKTASKLLSLIILAVVFVLRSILISYILPYIVVGNYEIDNTSSAMSFIVFTIIYIGLLVFVYDKSSYQIKGYINLFYISCLCLAFQDVTPVAARMASFFMFPLMIIIPDFIYNMREKRLARLYSLICVIVFLGYGLFRIDAGGEDFAQSSPYYWFWEDVQ